MTPLPINNFTVSKLTLGTAALGMDYGISNRVGQPPNETLQEILATALDCGINTWDTARHYGNAEEKIGDFMAAQIVRPPLHIVSKFRISNENLGDIQKVREEVYTSVRRSIALLHCAYLPVCLFHKRPDQPLWLITQVLGELIRNLKSDGLIGIGGVSLYHPEELPAFAQIPEVNAIQVPVNLFDHRLIHQRGFRELLQENKMIFARSIFLQGLFFMDPEELTGNLVAAAPYLRRLRILCERTGIPVAQLAFSYIRDMPGISSIIFGAVNVQEVKQNAALLASPPIPDDVKEEISFLFNNVPEAIITPGQWEPFIRQ